MTKFLRRLVSAAALCAAVWAVAISPASASPIFVGSWQVDQGPNWTTVPTAYSGVGAAQALFGPPPIGWTYLISTVDANPANIDLSAWISTWGGACGGNFPCGTIVAQNFVISTGGLYANFGDTSAYVQDWAVGAQFTNYAFIESVPEPGPLMLIAMALLSMMGLAVMRRRADV
jgi:hypothetical protein